ncbi:MAG: MarR family winged helix-turn-helix transcriptional regulator [Steroidobacteraceae bacterium]
MNTAHPLFELMEASLLRLSARMPDTPVAGVTLSRLLLYLGRGMAAMLEQQIRPFGLAEAEFRVLTALFSQPQGVAHPSELCARTSQSPANMSRISDALVSRNLITRGLSAQDRRRMVLRITEQGEDLVRRLLPLLFAPLREMFGELSDAEQQQLIAQLKRLGVRLDAVMAHESLERTP